MDKPQPQPQQLTQAAFVDHYTRAMEQLDRGHPLADGYAWDPYLHRHPRDVATQLAELEAQLPGVLPLQGQDFDADNMEVGSDASTESVREGAPCHQEPIVAAGTVPIEDGPMRGLIPEVHLLPGDTVGRITAALQILMEGFVARRNKGKGHPQGGIFYSDPKYTKIGWVCDRRYQSTMKAVLRVFNALIKEKILPLPMGAEDTSAGAAAFLDVGAGEGLIHFENPEGGDGFALVKVDGGRYYVHVIDPSGKERGRRVEVSELGAMYTMLGDIMHLYAHRHETEVPKLAIRIGLFHGSLDDKAARAPALPRPLVFLERGIGRSTRGTTEHHGGKVPPCFCCGVD